MNLVRVLVFEMSHPDMMNCSLVSSAQAQQSSKRPSHVQRVLSQSLLLGGLSSIAVLCGWVPNFSQAGAHPFDSAAYAQDEPAFNRYVRAAVEIEKTRQGLLEQVKQLNGGSVPSNVCHPDVVAQMNPGIRDRVKGICDTFAAQARQIVVRYRLSPTEFNTFQRQAQQDPGVRTQIDAKIRELGLR